MSNSKLKKNHKRETFSSYRVSDRSSSDQCDQDSGFL